MYNCQFKCRVKHILNLVRSRVGISQEQQNLFTQLIVVPRHDVEEMLDCEEMPKLYAPYSEQIMETELLKVKYLSYFDY